MASPDWVLDSLLGFLQSPFWNVTVNSFIDHNCVVFDPGEENKFTYTDIHREYATLVEEMLEGFVTDFRITSDQFVDACAQGLASDDIDEKLLDYVFAADDFLMFKSIMVKRNIELDLQVIDMVKRAQAARKQSPPQPQPEQAPTPAASSKEEEYDEEKVLQEVMKRSMTEFQQEQTAVADAEMERMLEAARLESTRLFEAMQAEEEQMARLLQATLALSQLANKEGSYGEPPQTVAGIEQVKTLGSAEQGEEPQELKERAESKLESTHEPQPEEQPRSIWDACLSPPPVGGASDGTDGDSHSSTIGSAPGGGGGGGSTSGGGTSGGGGGSTSGGDTSGGSGGSTSGGGTSGGSGGSTSGGDTSGGGGGTGSTSGGGTSGGGGGAGSTSGGGTSGDGGGAGSTSGGGTSGGGGGAGSTSGGGTSGSGGGGAGSTSGGGGGTSGSGVHGGSTMRGGGTASGECSSNGDGNRGSEGGGSSEFTDTGAGALDDHSHIFVSPECVAMETKTQTAAAAWLESAKRDAEQQSRGSTGPIPVDPDPENREAYWRLQKNRLLALKKEERARLIQTTAAVAHGHKLCQTAEVAQKVVDDPTASSGSSSEREERRQTLLTALANRLKKEASDATQD